MLCLLLGHKMLSDKRSFIISERYRRCERCGQRVLGKRH
jgi:DNA-directed RNA polymerase subunit RPC12/RpoP